MEFSPLFIVAIIWLLIAPILSAAKKQQAKNAKSGAAKQSGAKAPRQQPETNSTYVAHEARPTVMQPSITFSEHDDSVYQGSMNAVTGEGYDPCHDEQMAPLTLAESAVSAPAEEVPGIQLGWTGNDIVRGLVMSEILNRRKGRVS